MGTEMILAARNTVGESLVWDGPTGRLIWVDIVEKAIHALVPETGHHQRWQTPDFVTSLGLRKDGGAVVGLTKEIVLWDFDDHFTPFARVESALPGNRLNEGVVGPDGAFWIGTMQNNINPDGSPADITSDTGRLYRCTADGQVMPLSDDVFGITNTLVWTEDGDLITADTLRNELYRYRYDDQAARRSDRRTILSGFDRGLPDGSAMDREGCVWNCRVAGGSCIARIDPDGRIDRVVDLPCSWPTSCAFGGDDLKTLYITSARFTMDKDHLDRHPEEGGLFAINPGVQGIAGHRFG